MELSPKQLAHDLPHVLQVFLHEACHEDLTLPTHTPEEHVRELNAYGFPVRLSVDQFTHLVAQWREVYAGATDLVGMVRYTLDYLFPQSS